MVDHRRGRPVIHLLSSRLLRTLIPRFTGSFHKRFHPYQIARNRPILSDWAASAGSTTSSIGARARFRLLAAERRVPDDCRHLGNIALTQRCPDAYDTHGWTARISACTPVQAQSIHCIRLPRPRAGNRHRDARLPAEVPLCAPVQDDRTKDRAASRHPRHDIDQTEQRTGAGRYATGATDLPSTESDASFRAWLRS